MVYFSQNKRGLVSGVSIVGLLNPQDVLDNNYEQDVDKEENGLFQNKVSLLFIYVIL